MNALFNWIRANWKGIWGFGHYAKGHDNGTYVVVPVWLLAEHFGCEEADIIYGLKEEGK
tara:strand:- start:371 stop:547 length:177 start_codon:yes stop_codon:yes gene_type:complete